MAFRGFCIWTLHIYIYCIYKNICVQKKLFSENHTRIILNKSSFTQNWHSPLRTSGIYTFDFVLSHSGTLLYIIYEQELEIMDKVADMMKPLTLLPILIDGMTVCSDWIHTSFFSSIWSYVNQWCQM